MDLCHSNSDCEWLEMCCSNGCQKLCMRVPAGPPSFAKPTYLEPLHPLFPDRPIVKESPHFGPILPPAKPFPDYPDFRPPYYPPQPDLPPIPVVPLDPLNYMADVNPFAYGREDYFN
ncbi:uncharacterized protein LOC134980363 [Pseudophryne corroboree]|uniref:uncharacterized protein LOC134980363 n=1 Tax=Pseudophryne corroboree TaxID=495146 RepID=UPI003081F5CC